MATSKVEYLGGLRTKCTHLKSGVEVITDAPVDNNGKGESFSPTDLVATAYISCMMTIVGIYCDKHDLRFDKGVGTVEKIMGIDPRRVQKLIILLDLSGNDWSDKEQLKVKNAANVCPVAMSVSDDMEIELQYKF